MDFSFGEEADAVRASAEAVFSRHATPERLAEVEKTPDRFDDRLWSSLGQAGLLGLVVPEELGGAGLGMTGLCLLLEVQGRWVAPVPLWSTLVCGALPLVRFGTRAQQRRWLPGVMDGSVRLTASLADVAGIGGGPRVEAQPQPGGGFRLAGVATAVPQAHLASAVIVPAAVAGPDREQILAVVERHQDGVTLERAETTDRQVHPHVHLDGVAVSADDVLGDAAAVTATLEMARTGLCALALGVSEEALRRAAGHVNERHQFGRPLASFQAVKLRAADAWIDTEAMRVTLWQAAWRIDSGRDAALAVAVAKWWASEAGQRVVHAGQHLHGGLGADVSYPQHRYFLWGKQIELMLGAPSEELSLLGSALAAQLRTGALP